MRLLLVQNKLHKDFSELYPFVEVIEFKQIPREESAVEQNHEFDYLSNEIRKFESKVDGIVLSNWLNSDKEKEGDIFHSAFQLAVYIRLENNDVKSFPILILSKLSDKQLLTHSKGTPHILLASFGTKILNPDTIVWEFREGDDFSFDDDKTNSLEKVFDTSKEEIKREYHNIKSKIHIVDKSTSGHDIANQWGAYRMAQIAGIEKEINYVYPKTLYFKYLLANIDDSRTNVNTSNCTSFWDKDLHVLFIDDKYDDGWRQCLKGIFEKKVLKEEKSIVIHPKNEWNDAFLPDIQADKYDLILLDYYLDTNKGIDILPKIKKDNPVVPVIMFTASNKAWNMDELYEAGADGYYVKEHPDNAHDADFSVENFKNFHETVKKCLKKGELLRKYWSKINLIKQGWNFTNKGNQKNKERIEERLIMFLGLLKKAYEQTRFDKNTFFYSEWELAFLTLWSTLNEIQEVYYEKTQPNLTLTASNGNSYTHHTGNKRHIPITYLNLPFKKHYKWVYKTEIFIDYQYNLKEIAGQPDCKKDFYQIHGKQQSPLRYNTKNGTYSISNTQNTEVDFEQTLHVQIAFLLLKINAPSDLLSNLDTLNKNTRNHLYLTHGEDMSNPQFNKLYRKQRENTDWEKYIKQLFEIVYFLCTGQECTW